MTTYRERREARAARLRGWAEKREADATRVLESQPGLRHDWAFITQPGHIPERARMNARDERAYESLNKAHSMDARAGGIEAQLAHAIYSDDPDAAERLVERIAALEAQRDAIKARNADYRKAHGAELRTLGPYARNQAMPHQGYELTNLSADIRRNKQRLEALAVPHVPRSILARRDGDCARCDERIKAGTTIIEAEQHTWVHEGCVP